MKTAQRIGANTLFLSSGKLLGDLCTFVFLVYFARAFGIPVLGKYAFAMSVGGFLSVFVSLGLNILLTREVSRDYGRNARYAGNLLVTQVVLAAVVWGVIALIAVLAGFDRETRAILLILGAYQVLYRLGQLPRAQFNAHEEMRYSGLLESYHKIVILALGAGAILLWRDPVLALAAYPLSAFSMVVLGLVLAARRYGRPDIGVDFRFIGHLLRQAAPFLLFLLLTQFHDRTGVILLTLIRGEHATGTYSAADRLLTTISTGLWFFGAALFPVTSRIAAGASEQVGKFHDRAMRIMVVTVLPLATVIYLLGDPLIPLIFGPQFVASAGVLEVLTWSLPFTALVVVLSNTLMSMNLQKPLVTMQGAVFAGYLATCLVLIPRYGASGLAWAKLGATAVLCAAYFRYASVAVHRTPLRHIALAPVAACAAAVLVDHLTAGAGPYGSAAAAIAVGAVLLVALGGVRRHDLEYLKRIVLGRS